MKHNHNHNHNSLCKLGLRTPYKVTAHFDHHIEHQRLVQINALDIKKLLMIIRGFRPTSDIIDFTSVERCNQYYISRESHFK